MNKSLVIIILVIIAFFAVKNVQSTQTKNEIKLIAKNLAIAALNKDDNNTVLLVNELTKKNAEFEYIDTTNANCHTVVYTYQGKKEKVEQCK